MQKLKWENKNLGFCEIGQELGENVNSLRNFSFDHHFILLVFRWTENKLKDVSTLLREGWNVSKPFTDMSTDEELVEENIQNCFHRWLLVVLEERT